MLKGLLIVLAVASWLVVMSPRPAYAYIDPGTTGWLYQIGYYIFYAVLGFVAMFYRHIKAFFGSMRNRLFPPRT